jgi:hypothetical protein
MTAKRLQYPPSFQAASIELRRVEASPSTANHSSSHESCASCRKQEDVTEEDIQNKGHLHGGYRRGQVVPHQKASTCWLRCTCSEAASRGRSPDLACRYCEDKFVSKYIPTIGVDYGVKPIKLGDYEVIHASVHLQMSLASP